VWVESEISGSYGVEYEDDCPFVRELMDAARILEASGYHCDMFEDRCILGNFPTFQRLLVLVMEEVNTSESQKTAIDS
jgi:hypothetical protein